MDATTAATADLPVLLSDADWFTPVERRLKALEARNAHLEVENTGHVLALQQARDEIAELAATVQRQIEDRQILGEYICTTVASIERCAGLRRTVRIRRVAEGAVILPVERRHGERLGRTWYRGLFWYAVAASPYVAAVVAVVLILRAP